VEIRNFFIAVIPRKLPLVSRPPNPNPWPHIDSASTALSASARRQREAHGMLPSRASLSETAHQRQWHPHRAERGRTQAVEKPFVVPAGALPVPASDSYKRLYRA
jgi:hypothetical protein